MCCRHEPQVMSRASFHAASIRTSQTGVQIKVQYRSHPKCITDHNGNEANDARTAKRVQHSAARMALGQLWTDRAIKVVDRSAIQRSDRGAISDNTTVIYRTIVTGLVGMAADQQRLVLPASLGKQKKPDSAEAESSL